MDVTLVTCGSAGYLEPLLQRRYGPIKVGVRSRKYTPNYAIQTHVCLLISEPLYIFPFHEPKAACGVLVHRHFLFIRQQQIGCRYRLRHVIRNVRVHFTRVHENDTIGSHMMNLCDE